MSFLDPAASSVFPARIRSASDDEWEGPRRDARAGLKNREENQ
jgi:hypothetical protein